MCSMIDIYKIYIYDCYTIVRARALQSWVGDTGNTLGDTRHTRYLTPSGVLSSQPRSNEEVPLNIAWWVIPDTSTG